MRRTLAAITLVLAAGCSTTADARLMVIHEAKLVLRHSTTDPAWADRRAKCEAQIQQEDPDDTTTGGN